MSKLVDQVLEVLRQSKAAIVYHVDQNHPDGISEENAKSIIKQQIKSTARKMNVQSSTITSACTRSLKIATVDEFANIVLDSILGRDNYLENTLIANSRHTLDNPANIKALLKNI